ncbi:hypothetical protein AB1K32_15050 [Metabacillus dongyingensis]|uniref:hypothetical protein n=1 Tax=Metabacillus dongyingensis TaxID=2874282 RepID=UPI003B8CF37E
MGFNITQIINKHLPTKRVDDDLRENPYNTVTGQEVVSTSENFWARLGREGRFRGSTVQGTSVTANTLSFKAVVKPSLGHRLYPKRAIVSSDVDAILYIRVLTGIKRADEMTTVCFCKAGNPYIVDFDGDVYLEEDGEFAIAMFATTDGKVYGATNGVEVAINA